MSARAGPKRVKISAAPLARCPGRCSRGEETAFRMAIACVPDHQAPAASRQRAAAGARQADQARLRALARLSADWFWELDAALRFSHCEGAMRRPFGLLPAQLLGRTCEQAAADAPDPQPLLQLGAACRAGAPIVGLLLRAKARNGRARWLRVDAEPVERGPVGAPRYVGTLRDVTEQQRTQREGARALARAEQGQDRLNSVLDALAAGVVVRDLRRVAYCNQAFAHLLGYPAAQALAGRPVEEFVHADDLAASRAGYRATLAGMPPQPAARTLLRADGGAVRALVSPVRVSWGGLPQVLAVVQPLDAGGHAMAGQDAVAREVRSLLRHEGRFVSRQLAHTLHEELGSDLAGISLLLGSLLVRAQQGELSAAALAEALVQPLTLVTQAIVQVRDLARSLEPGGPLPLAPDGPVER